MLAADKVSKLFTLKSKNKRTYHRNSTMLKAENTPTEKRADFFLLVVAKSAFDWMPSSKGISSNSC